MSDNPYSTPATESATSQTIGTGSWTPVIQPLRDVAGWSRFLGIMLIIIGVIYCLSIVGVIIGWLPIWLGILLLKSSDNVKAGNADQATEGVRLLSKAIKIAGVAAAVFLGFMVLYFVFVVAILIFGMAQSPPPAGGF